MTAKHGQGRRAKRGSVSTQYPPGSHLESGKMPSENSAVSTVSTYSKEIVPRGVKSMNRGQQATIGNEVDTWIPGSQKWEGKGLVQVGHPTPVKRFVALNESGTQRIGEDHSHAKLTDAQVEQIRDEYEAYPPGHPQHVGYRVLAQRWGMGKSTIRKICNYTIRNQWAGRWKRIT